MNLTGQATWRHARLPQTHKVRTAERGLIFRLEEVFSDEENMNVALTLSRWNQIEQEILTLWDVLHGPDNDKGALPVAV